MGFYSGKILPRLCHLAMRNERLLPYRKRAAGAAEGLVVEIGVGPGLNFPFYGAGVIEVLGIDPSPQLLAMAKQAAKSSPVPVTLVEGTAEAIPLSSKSADTIVMTWTLCSVPHAGEALREIRRVLKPGGRLLFAEHGLAPQARIRCWQNVLTPPWSLISGGCHLNRPVKDLIEAAGFRLDRLETGYIKGPKPFTYFYEGCAEPR
ncbi:MAG TPA: class I SAM-dependent methyltransferase [Methylocella sp.]|nr:class I SAM-dependent methyltransferase [Methylocella sp.]